MYTESQQTHKFWAENDDFVVKYKRQIASILNCDNDSIINFVVNFEFYIYNNLYNIYTIDSLYARCHFQEFVRQYTGD